MYYTKKTIQNSLKFYRDCLDDGEVTMTIGVKQVIRMKEDIAEAIELLSIQGCYWRTVATYRKGDKIYPCPQHCSRNTWCAGCLALDAIGRCDCNRTDDDPSICEKCSSTAPCKTDLPTDGSDTPAS